MISELEPNCQAEGASVEVDVICWMTSKCLPGLEEGVLAVFWYMGFLQLAFQELDLRAQDWRKCEASNKFFIGQQCFYLIFANCRFGQVFLHPFPIYPPWSVLESDQPGPGPGE